MKKATPVLKTFPLICLVLALLPARSLAQSPASAPAQSMPTLAAALAAAKPPDGTVALAVAAAKVHLQDGYAPTHKDASLEQVAYAYGQLIQPFGKVTALAPPTMIVLNANPGQANVFENMPAKDAFTLLAASLTPGQLQALTSTRGLGLSDLLNDYQRGLFVACIPNRTLRVTARASSEPPPPKQVIDVSDQLSQARMRLGQLVGLALPDKNGSGSNMPNRAVPGAPPIYDYVPGNGLFNQNIVDGVQVRAEVPNSPKEGQLDFKAASWQVPVPLSGLKTVGALISRISTVTHTELYADKRYEGRTITLAGSPPSAVAGDLLRALALCVTGTYRKVGPAFVLTDDVVGLGTRRRILSKFQNDNAARRQVPLKEAEDHLEAAQVLRSLTLNGFGDPLAVTPEEMAKADKNTVWLSASMGLNLPLDQLTPAQQDAVQRDVDYLDQTRRDHPEVGPMEPDLSKKITLLLRPSVQLLVPGLNGPIDTDLGRWIAMMFQDKSRNKLPMPQEAATSAAPTPTLDLASLLKPIPRRAVVVHPKTLAEVDTVVARMKKLGLNQLWLDVFSNGVAHIPGTPLSPPDQPDLLAEALKAAKGSGIAVFPTLELLKWGRKPGEARVDLTILGENSAQSDARENASGVMVSPFVLDVQRLLLTMTHTVLAHPGIAGVVWRETTPLGYDPPKNSFMTIEPGDELGYNEAARLAFLRHEHADPLDLDTLYAHSMDERADTSLPNFDDYGVRDDLAKKWDKFRSDTDLALLGALYAASAIRPAGVTLATVPLPILVQQRRADQGTSWYGSWDSPKAPFPTRRDPLLEWDPSQPSMPMQDEATQARSQSRLTLIRLPTDGALDGGNLVSQWGRALTDVGKNHKWDGFVLEWPTPEPDHTL